LGDSLSQPRKGKVPLSDVEAEARGIRVDRDGLVRCRVCGCTEREPCCPPCAWWCDEVDLCDTCAFVALAIKDWIEGAHQPSKAALWREVERIKR
jgi:hypothetical protein